MKKALVAAVLMVLYAAGCNKQHVNKVKTISVAIHEVVDCNAVQAVPVIDPRTSAKLCVAREAIVTEKQIRAAQAGGDYSTNKPEVFVYLDRAGADRMYEATQRISARYGQVAILINGRLVSMPTVRTAIKDSLIIEGGLTERAAQDLAYSLNGG